MLIEDMLSRVLSRSPFGTQAGELLDLRKLISNTSSTRPPISIMDTDIDFISRGGKSRLLRTAGPVLDREVIQVYNFARRAPLIAMVSRKSVNRVYILIYRMTLVRVWNGLEMLRLSRREPWPKAVI